MNPLRAWWEEDRELTARFYHEALGIGGDVPYFCEPWICRRILDMHLNSPAMLTILPLQDWFSTDGELRYPDPAKERINVPAVADTTGVTGCTSRSRNCCTRRLSTSRCTT